LNWIGFLNEVVRGCWDNVSLMAVIIIPIMIILEIARDLKILDRVGERLAPALKFLGMSKEAASLLMVGLGFGISYGAGVIIEAARSGRLSWQDLFLLNLFLSICHAVVEDTALFMAVGADGVVSRSGWMARQAEKHSTKDFTKGMDGERQGHNCC
jgi:hypothetical protein